MNRPLFVHPNTKLLDRLVQESNSVAMVTTSMIQALKWITNQEVPLSGVYLNPDDPTFSAFRFLEITLTHRPALPIYLFESKLGQNTDGAKRVMKNTHVRGVFLGSEPYKTLVSGVKENINFDAETRAKSSEFPQQPGYLTVPISDFASGTHYLFDTFLLDGGSMVLFAQKESEIDSAYLEKASKRTQFLYVREKDVLQHKEDIKKVQSRFLDDDDLPNNWKTAETMVGAKNLLDEMKGSGVSEQVVEYTQDMLGDLFKLISKIESDEGSLHSMIERAKQCDRSVFCASYSMLICKQLRYEKTATLEILGLASVLQDIALYRTPLGDLSSKLAKDLNEEEKKIYQQHPTLSADVVAQHTDVPQVTLQVIRQHHERKDKSGFPHRVGGNQLHPMAEILSLINSFYEVTQLIPDDDAGVIQELQSSVFPHYSEAVVTAFKQVLGTVLKDKIHSAEGDSLA